MRKAVINFKKKKETFNLFQVKSSLLNFLHSLVQVMDVSDLMNSADSRLAISRIINWTTEPKSVEVRKVCYH